MLIIKISHVNEVCCRNYIIYAALLLGKFLIKKSKKCYRSKEQTSPGLIEDPEMLSVLSLCSFLKLSFEPNGADVHCAVKTSALSLFENSVSGAKILVCADELNENLIRKLNALDFFF